MRRAVRAAATSRERALGAHDTNHLVVSHLTHQLDLQGKRLPCRANALEEPPHIGPSSELAAVGQRARRRPFDVVTEHRQHAADVALSEGCVAPWTSARFVLMCV